MNTPSPISELNQAVRLWLWTNLWGMAGTWTTLVAGSMIPRPHRPIFTDFFFIVALIGVPTAVGSAVVIPVARVALGRLLLLPRYWPRLTATLAAAVGVCLMVIVLLGSLGASLVEGGKFAPRAVMLMGGWAYVLAAPVLVARIYRRPLFRANQPSPHQTDTF